MRRNRRSADSPSRAKTQLYGLAVSAAVTVALTAAAAGLIASGRLPEELMNWAAGVCAFIGAAAGGLAAASRLEGRRFLTGCAAGGILLLIYIGVSAALGGPRLLQLAPLLPGGALGGAAAAFRRAHR